MYDAKRFTKAIQTWQQAWLSYGNMLVSANEVIRHRTLDMMFGTMNPEEVTRMFLEKPATFAKSYEMAARAAAANRGTAAAALAAMKPYEAKTRSNSTRLRTKR